jgi:hypothetical protein
MSAALPVSVLGDSLLLGNLARRTAELSKHRLAALRAEIVEVLRAEGPMGYCGLEDRCHKWRAPIDLKMALAGLIADREVLVDARPLKPRGVFLTYRSAP